MENSPFNKISKLLIIAIPLLILDQLTKTWAIRTLSDKNLFIGKSEIGFSLTSNSGSAFSMFQSSTLALTVFGCVLAVGVLISACKTKSKYVFISLSLIFAGALGNLTDRFFRYPHGGHGHVIDFIKFMSFPTFNIADSCIVIGAMLLMYSLFKEGKEA